MKMLYLQFKLSLTPRDASSCEEAEEGFKKIMDMLEVSSWSIPKDFSTSMRRAMTMVDAPAIITFFLLE
jgi:hypothetical protein